MVGLLYALQWELKDYSAAWQSLDRYEELSPLMEKAARKWLATQRAGAAYYLGDIDAAVRYNLESGEQFAKTVAANLQDPARQERKTVLLPVGFVRQHHMTCAPATLSALSRYWDKPADHLEVAEQICYNGTSNYNERHWAEENGWFAKEFSVTEESAAALIDAGLPFTLTTVDVGNAHLQAVIGYDARRGILIIRDPFMRYSREAVSTGFLDRYRAFGPRGMVFAPANKRGIGSGFPARRESLGNNS